MWADSKKSVETTKWKAAKLIRELLPNIEEIEIRVWVSPQGLITPLRLFIEISKETFLKSTDYEKKKKSTDYEPGLTYSTKDYEKTETLNNFTVIYQF